MSGRGVLEGAFALLESLNALGGRAGFAELMRAADLPKTTTHRLLDQLVELGAVERGPEGYRTGSRVFRLGQSWQPELRELAREWLPVLSARLGAGVFLAVPREQRVLVVEGAGIRPGTILPPGTASGRLLAAHAHPVGEPGRDAGEILARGFAADAGSAAVPVRTPDGRTAAALAAVPLPGRSPLALVDGLAGTARTLGAALTA